MMLVCWVGLDVLIYNFSSTVHRCCKRRVLFAIRYPINVLFSGEKQLLHAVSRAGAKLLDSAQTLTDMDQLVNWVQPRCNSAHHGEDGTRER